jgi:hypothetical protein
MLQAQREEEGKRIDLGATTGGAPTGRWIFGNDDFFFGMPTPSNRLGVFGKRDQSVRIAVESNAESRSEASREPFSASIGGMVVARHY